MDSNSYMATKKQLSWGIMILIDLNATLWFINQGMLLPVIVFSIIALFSAYKFDKASK